MTSAESRTPALPRIHDRFTRALPADAEPSNQRRQVQGAAYSRVSPTPVADPRILAVAREVAEDLGLDPRWCTSREFAEVMGGNRLLPGMDPHAMCYGGHQFGNWAGQLGDGRAINLGEIEDRRGVLQMLQLKGAGPTPYSRTADGRAVLRSSVREFLCSEAMHHLGVPTTRALSLAGTGESVIRDMFYDGNPSPEPGAVVCRVAPSFVRFGNFQLPAARGDHELLRALHDHVMRAHAPELGEPCAETRLEWLREVARATARMIVHWQRVGFVHGVMNTDNMSIHGLTIDYGPYGWLDDFDPDWTPNTTDAGGRRYRYGNQPGIALWNLARLAEALHPLIEDLDALQAALGEYVDTFQHGWRRMMADKLGLAEFQEDPDTALCEELQELMTAAETDMTLFHRELARVPVAPDADDDTLLEPLEEAYYTPADVDPAHRRRLADWLRRWGARVRDAGTDDARRARMDAANPRYVLRNYMAQLAIDEAERGDPALISELLDVLRRPYEARAEAERWARKRPDWARQRAGCSMLSCSS